MLRPHRRVHAYVWTVLGLLLPLIIAAALILKLTQPPLPPNVQLTPQAQPSQAKP